MKSKMFVGMLVFILMVLSIGVFSQEANYSNNIFPIEQVKHGTTGYGVSDLGPDVPNKFKFRVTSIEKDGLGYGHDIIWAILYDNPKLKDGGVIAGMSGSPCYSTDGRFLGTVSYGYNNSVEVKAGITPAKDVLSVNDKNVNYNNTGQCQANSVPYSARSPNNLINLMQISRFPELDPFFNTTPFFVRNGIGSESQEKIAKEILQAGDSIGVALVVGDMTVAGTGTVSWVFGKDIWVFGHPMLQMGEINFPMIAAKTDDVTLLRTQSFKETATGEVIGTFTQDRLSAVYGHLGQKPDLIPVTVNLDRNGKNDILHFYIVRQKQLTPILMKIIIGNLLSEFSDAQELSVFSKGEIALDGADTKSLYFSEHGNGLISSVESYYAMEIAYILAPTNPSGAENNTSEKDKKPIMSARIKGIDISLSVSEGDKTFNIEEIKNNIIGINENSVCNIDIMLKNSRESKVISLSLDIPNNFKGDIMILAGDAKVMTISSEKENPNPNTGKLRQQDDLNSMIKKSFSKGSLYIKIVYIQKTSDPELSLALRQVSRTEIYEVTLDNIIVQGQKKIIINVNK